MHEFMNVHVLFSSCLLLVMQALNKLVQEQGVELKKLNERISGLENQLASTPGDNSVSASSSSTSDSDDTSAAVEFFEIEFPIDSKDHLEKFNKFLSKSANLDKAVSSLFPTIELVKLSYFLHSLTTVEFTF